MQLPDLQKLIISSSSRGLRTISALNPLTIRKKGTRAKAIFALAMVCFFWGTTWIASKQGVKHMPALQMAGIRQLIAGVCYVAYFMSKGFSLPKGKEWIPVLLLSFLNFMMANGLSTWGVQYMTAGLGAIIGAIFPLWIVVISLFTSQKVPLKAIIGLLLGFAGVCIIFYDHLGDFLQPDFRKGILLSVAATWAWAIGTLYTKRKVALFNPYYNLGWQMLISGVVLLVVTQLVPSTSSQAAIPFGKIPWQGWTAIAYLTVIGSIITFIAYLYALQNLPTEQTSIYAYINPVVAMLLGWAFFSESLTVYIAIGGVVALAGVFMVNKAFRAQPKEQPEAEGV